MVREATGIDVSQCHACLDCTVPAAHEMDIPLGSLVQMVLYNDEEALSCRTVWSEAVLAQARSACHRGMDIAQIILALRAEAQRRGVPPPTIH